MDGVNRPHSYREMSYSRQFLKIRSKRFCSCCLEIQNSWYSLFTELCKAYIQHIPRCLTEYNIQYVKCSDIVLSIQSIWEKVTSTCSMSTGWETRWGKGEKNWSSLIYWVSKNWNICCFSLHKAHTEKSQATYRECQWTFWLERGPSLFQQICDKKIRTEI